MARQGTAILVAALRAPTNPLEQLMTEHLINLDELARLLGRSPSTIKKDLRRNPSAVPPRIQLPGTRLLRWRSIDVEIWLAEHVESRAKERT